jgi:tetratricopeptide (TPR) repeat protein
VLLALKLYPQEPFVTYNLGEEYRKAGMFKPAARMFQRSLEITPNYKDGLERLAMCLANLGRLQEAAGPAAGAMRQGAKEWKVMRDILIAAGEERRHIRGGAGSLLPRAADSSAGREPSRSRILPELPQNAPPDSIGNRTALRNLL